MSLTHLRGGTLYDPANGVAGEPRDLWIRDGRIVPPPPAGTHADRGLDLSGLVVMPGGVDLHCHIAGPKVNVARKLRCNEPVAKLPRAAGFRSGTLGSVPSTFATGYKYAGLGYTTAFDAAVPPLGARHAHLELADTPCVDSGLFVLAGNHHYLLEQFAAGEAERATAFLGWLIESTGAFAPKLVNPGGVEIWKQSRSGHSTHFDDVVPLFGLTPRAIVTGVAQAAAALQLPHPVHIHCNQLGMPGNWQTTLATMQALGHLRGHLTHIQFHSYGGEPDDQSSLTSRVAELAEYVNTHPNITIDVGQVMFGATTALTGDAPLGYFLHQIYGQRYYSGDTECEGGCGVMPIRYRDRNWVHAMQWAVGLEWFLLVKNPWQVALSTDHPNGASFLAYPQVIRLLMDRDHRRATLAKCPPRVRERTILADLDREYTLAEIAIITRAAPARMLGLTHKGHFAPGADADVTVYEPSADAAEMFAHPRLVLKNGDVVLEEGQLRHAIDGRRIVARRPHDRAALEQLPRWFADHYSVQFENFALSDEELGEVSVV